MTNLGGDMSNFESLRYFDNSFWLILGFQIDYLFQKAHASGELQIYPKRPPKAYFTVARKGHKNDESSDVSETLRNDRRRRPGAPSVFQDLQNELREVRELQN